MNLLGHVGLNRLLAAHFPGGSDESDDEYFPYGRRQRLRRRRDNPPALEKVPSAAGRALMEKGVFGGMDCNSDAVKRSDRIAYRLMQREIGVLDDGCRRSSKLRIEESMIPGSTADLIIQYGARCYSGQFSKDGNFFFSCSQDFRVRMYDTSNPYDWKHYKVRPVLFRATCC